MSPSWNKKTGLKIPWFNFSAKTFRRLELFCCSTILFAFLLISRKMVPELRACWLFERKKIIYVWVCVSFCPSTKFWLWSSWTVWLKTNLILENPNIWHIFVKENNILPHLVQLENFIFACILVILQVGPRSGYKMYVWQQISNGTAQISSGTTSTSNVSQCVECFYVLWWLYTWPTNDLPLRWNIPMPTDWIQFNPIPLLSSSFPSWQV